MIKKNDLTICLIITLVLFALLLYFIWGAGLNSKNIYFAHAVLWGAIFSAFVLAIVSTKYASDKYLKMSREKYDILFPLINFKGLTLEQKKKIVNSFLNSS